jgi:hypothetical protein
MTAARPREVPDLPVLPEQTGDDVDTDWRERGDDDDRLTRERPPHWE